MTHEQNIYTLNLGKERRETASSPTHLWLTLKKNVASLTILFTEIQSTSWPSLTLNACELQRHWPASLQGLDPAFSQQSRVEATRGRKLPLVGRNPERNSKRRKQTGALYSVFSRGGGTLVHEGIGVAQSCSSCLKRSVTGCGVEEAILSAGTKASSLPFMLTKGRRGWVGLQSVSRVLRYLGMAAAAAAAREKSGTTSVTPYQPDKQ